jgi:hypothetical protein
VIFFEFYNLNFLKYFLVSCGITCLVILLVTGLVVTEKNIKKMEFDQDTSLFEYDFKNKNKFIKFVFMGQKFKFDF